MTAPDTLAPGAPCPCGSERPFEACCGPYLSSAAEAPTAEALMRSRYTAYALEDWDHVLRTWHPSRRPEREAFETEAELRWLGLEILQTEAGGPEDQEGWVEFVARYETGGREERIREASRFVREEGRWLYVDGKTRRTEPSRSGKVGRNAPCPCGSGRKYKKCCGR